MLKTTLLALLILASQVSAQKPASVFITFYSESGKTKAMAEAVAQGARSVESVTVKLVSVSDATILDVLQADAIILGTPVHNAAVVPAVQAFINSWPFDGRMKDKIGAAFVTAGGISAGEELALTSILHSMLVFGMIVVGGPEWMSAFGAAAVTSEPPFDSTSDVDRRFLKKGEALGERVARLAIKLRGS
jgi:NAD(P)H dehydrogenase (quinone)